MKFSIKDFFRKYDQIYRKLLCSELYTKENQTHQTFKIKLSMLWFIEKLKQNFVPLSFQC